MQKVLAFPPPRGGGAISTPVNHQPGDDYIRIDVVDDIVSSVGIFPGTTIVVLKGALWDRLLHAVEFDGITYMGALHLLDSMRVEFASWHEGERSGVYRMNEIKILGAVCEIYPHGDEGPRWVLTQSGQANAVNHTHGRLLEATAKA
jgi:hypothetical protein